LQSASIARLAASFSATGAENQESLCQIYSATRNRTPHHLSDDRLGK
jgi:hypothetical protein